MMVRKVSDSIRVLTYSYNLWVGTWHFTRKLCTCRLKSCKENGRRLELPVALCTPTGCISHKLLPPASSLHQVAEESCYLLLSWFDLVVTLQSVINRQLSKLGGRCKSPLLYLCTQGLSPLHLMLLLPNLTMICDTGLSLLQSSHTLCLPCILPQSYSIPWLLSISRAS